VDSVAWIAYRSVPFAKLGLSLRTLFSERDWETVRSSYCDDKRCRYVTDPLRILKSSWVLRRSRPLDECSLDLGEYPNDFFDVKRPLPRRIERVRVHIDLFITRLHFRSYRTNRQLSECLPDVHVQYCERAKLNSASHVTRNFDQITRCRRLGLPLSVGVGSTCCREAYHERERPVDSPDLVRIFGPFDKRDDNIAVVVLFTTSRL
jgi:hypothetical protein